MDDGLIAEDEPSERSVGGCVGAPGQGPFMALALKLRGDRIIAARYVTYGCPAAQSVGQWVCEQLEGKSIVEASTLDEAAILAGVGDMPLGREHCPGLAVGALRKAIAEIS